MIVVAHQTIGMTAPADTVNDVGQLLKKQRAVPIIRNNVPSGIAATRDMVDDTEIFKAQRTGHGGTLQQSLCQIIRPDPL